MEKVRAGQPLAIRARDWNALADMVNNKGAAVPQARRQTPGEQGLVYVHNTTENPLDCYTVVLAHSLSPALSATGERAVADEYFVAALPGASTPGTPVVLQEQIAPGTVGRAMLYGVTPALVNGTSDVGAFLAPTLTAEGKGALAAAEAGIARVLSAPTTGSSYALVQIGIGGGGGGAAAPRLMELRTGRREIGGVDYCTVEAYTGFNGYLTPPIVYVNNDNPGPGGIGVADSPHFLDPGFMLNLGDGWAVILAIKPTAEAHSGVFGMTTPTPGWMPGNLQPFPWGMLIAKRVDEEQWHEMATIEGDSRLPLAADWEETHVVMIYGGWHWSNELQFTVSNIGFAPFRVSVATGAEYLYAEVPASTADDGETLTLVGDDTELTHESALAWCAVPILAFYGDSGALIGTRATRWETLPAEYAHTRTPAVMHASLHYAEFIK